MAWPDPTLHTVHYTTLHNTAQHYTVQYSTVFSVARQPLVVQCSVGDLPGDYLPSRPNPALVLYLHFPTVQYPTTKVQHNYFTSLTCCYVNQNNNIY